MKVSKIFLMTAFISFLGCFLALAGDTEDSRQLINLPQDIQSKMLNNMRDHIVALDEIVGAVETGEYEKAQDIAEFRLGWSSLVRQGDQEVANHWAVPMQKMADEMYRSSSDFVIVVQNASVEQDKESYVKVLSALHKVTSACRSCHEAFRVR